MSVYETQEPLEDGAEEDPLDYARHVDIPQADAQAPPSTFGSSPNFHVFYHAYNELYVRSCELLQFAQRRESDSDAGLIGSVTDELRNQKACLCMFDEYLKNVWVQIYLDDSGRLQVAQMMSMQTTIQGLFSQLPQLAQNLLEVVLDNSPPLASDFQLRLVCDFPDIPLSAGQTFDIPVHSSVTLGQIMHEYIPGTFQLAFRLLYRGEPVNLAALMLEQLQKTCNEGAVTAGPVQTRHKPTAHAIGPTQAQQPHSPRKLSRTPNGKGRIDDVEFRKTSLAQQSRSPSFPGAPVAADTKNELHQQEQASEGGTHLQQHNKPLSAKQLLSSGLVLNLQDWDHVAKACSDREDIRRASGAEEHVVNAGASRGLGSHPSDHTDMHKKASLRSKSGNPAVRPSTDEDEPKSNGRGRKRQRVRSTSASPVAGPSAAILEPAVHSGQVPGRPQLPAHVVRSPVGPVPDPASRFQWKVEDVALLLKGIQHYGKQWSTIQSQFFTAHPGTSFQSKMKDKWRSLCQVIEKKHAARKSLPDHLWKQVESLKRLHGMQ